MSKTILVIEDNPKHSILFEDLLRGQGYEVITAKNGEEVQQRMNESFEENKPFDLLLVDISVPQFDAIEFIKGKKDHYQILVVSAYADREDVKELLPENRRIKKPFDINLFRNRVKEILDQQDGEKAK